MPLYFFWYTYCTQRSSLQYGSEVLYMDKQWLMIILQDFMSMITQLVSQASSTSWAQQQAAHWCYCLAFDIVASALLFPEIQRNPGSPSGLPPLEEWSTVASRALMSVSALYCHLIALRPVQDGRFLLSIKRKGSVLQKLDSRILVYNILTFRSSFNCRIEPVASTKW